MLNWKNSRILRIFVRTVASVLIAAFLSYDLVWAGASEVLASAGTSIPAIEIPRNSARLRIIICPDPLRIGL